MQVVKRRKRNLYARMIVLGAISQKEGRKTQQQQQ